MVNWDEYKLNIKSLTEEEKSRLSKVASTISLLDQAISQLEEDFKRVETDTGRTVIADSISTFKLELKLAEEVYRKIVDVG